jgi:hypothetical protein
MRSIEWSEHMEPMEPMVLITRADEYSSAVRILEIRPSRPSHGAVRLWCRPTGGMDLAPQSGASWPMQMAWDALVG